jgi:ectoine hydroxylase-related dioxygenase (phytanoyl-CoA dioxygenase family)
MPAPTLTLKSEQVTFFKEQGYLSLPAITTPEEVEWLREIYDRLFAMRAGREEGNQFDLAGTDEEDKEATLPQILRPSKYAPELKEGIYRANALAIAAQLLGPEAEYMGEHAIFKPPQIGAETPWHQDEAYWDPGLEYEALSIWIPLQEATLENGCMQFMPGTHRREVQPHHHIGNDPRVHGLVVDEVDPGAAAICPIPAGGATIHHCRTLHYAGPNRSDIPRRAYILLFRLPPRKRAEGRNFYWQADAAEEPREQRRAAARKRSGAGK